MRWKPAASTPTVDRLIDRWSATAPTDVPAPTDRPDRRPTDRNADLPTAPPDRANRPPTDRPAAPTGDRRPTGSPTGDRKANTVDDRARRAQVADQHGTVGIPRGYGAAFALLLATTVISGGAAFLFSFGNVKETAAMFGVLHWIQPLFAGAIDVIVIGLTGVMQWLSLANANPATIRQLRRFLLAAGLAMLAANVAPSIVGAFATSYTGPMMRATADFTPTFDQMTQGQLIGRALFEAVIPAALIWWSHLGPKAVRAFGEIRARADRAALAVVQARTLATDADRAAAAAAKAAADRILADARTAADRITAEADQARAAAADRLAAIQATADRAAVDADRTRSAAEQDAAAEADRLRRAADRLTADRAELDAEFARVRDLEREATEMMRAAEDLVAEAARNTPTVDRPTAQPTNRPPKPAAKRTAAARTAGDKGDNVRQLVTADQLFVQRVQECKEKHFPDWRTRVITKKEVMDALGKSSDIANPIRRQLEIDRLALTVEHTAQAN